MSGIFISYRREDSAAHAGRLYDRLSAQFGADQVFMDVDDIPPGADFARQIDAKVGSCDAMVVVIGKNWLATRNAAGQLRLSDPDDFVGLEVSLALQRNVLVIPVLVGGAQVPGAEELRADLRDLARRNALTLNDQEFQRDTDALINALEKLPGLRKRPAAVSDEKYADLRKKLLRRLVWKVPLILLLMSFAVWWQSSKEQGSSPGTNAAVSAAFAGDWAGEVTYPWGAKYSERFTFKPDGSKLFGTAGFLGSGRGIEDGQLEGDSISFSTRFEEVSGTEKRARKNRYWGKLTGRNIAMRMQDDSGDPAVEWILSKSAPQ
jgi:TIR domain